MASITLQDFQWGNVDEVYVSFAAHEPIPIVHLPSNSSVNKQVNRAVMIKIGPSASIVARRICDSDLVGSIQPSFGCALE